MADSWCRFSAGGPCPSPQPRTAPPRAPVSPAAGFPGRRCLLQPPWQSRPFFCGAMGCPGRAGPPEAGALGAAPNPGCSRVLPSSSCRRSGAGPSVFTRRLQELTFPGPTASSPTSTHGPARAQWAPAGRSTARPASNHDLSVTSPHGKHTDLRGASQRRPKTTCEKHPAQVGAPGRPRQGQSCSDSP